MTWLSSSGRGPYHIFFCGQCNTGGTNIIFVAVRHIPIPLLSFGGVACRISFTSSANEPKTWWEGNFAFFSGRNVNL